MFLALELCLAAVCIAIALIRPQSGDAGFLRVESRLVAFAERPALSMVTIGLAALVLRLALLPILPIPVPQVDDEFSHLLLADTLAHGRLANPPHAMWVHFETFFVNWQPTYSSMYYPGHALFLALGQVVFKHPFWGVWLSTGLMCAAFYWALQGWMSPGLAFLGGMLAVVRLATFSYWNDSYWGGSVIALGGALVLGALPRLKARKRTWDSILMGLGMGLLAASRPYEGLFFCLPILAVLAWWLLVKREPRPNSLRVLLPGGCVVLCTLIALGYYFKAVTGSPFTTPYQLNIRAYGMIYFPWNKLNPVEFRHAGLAAFYRGPAVVNFLDLARHHQIRLQALKALVIWLFYFGPILTLPWIAWLCMNPRGLWRSPQFRFLFISGFVTYIAFMLPFAIGQPHYIAPMAVVFYALTALIIGMLYTASPAGRFIARSVPLVCVILFCVRTAVPLAHMNPKPSWIRTWCSQDYENLGRERILEQLERTPGMHLAIVRYAPNHNFILDEWVFNNADIDGSKVIWARDMGAQNAELVNYFKERKVWLVEPDANPPKLTPYAE